MHQSLVIVRFVESIHLVLLGDQHAGPKGCWVDFFGQPASCHKGVALFTLTSGAPMAVLDAEEGKLADGPNQTAGMRAWDLWRSQVRASVGW